MNKILLLLLCAFATFSVESVAQCTGSDPIISQVVEGDSNNKAIEITNPSTMAINLDDYNLELVANANSSGNNVSIPAGTMVLPGATYVIANTNANFSGDPVVNQTSGSISHNGNDKYIIRRDSDNSIVDSYGQVGNSTNFGVNMSMQRKLTSGMACPYDTDVTDAFDPAAYESVAYSADLPIGLGQAALPVELTKFTATKRNTNSVLSWETATEVNNERFVVQRSTNGQDFYALGTVAGNGNSTDVIGYSFTDYSPASGINYYRLKQVDFNGAFEYSSVVKVDNRGTGNTNVYPTVVSDFLTIDNKEDAEIRIYNVTGNVVLTAKVASGNSQIDMTDYIAGTYFVSIISGTETMTKQVIKN